MVAQISQGREFDREIRQNILEVMSVALRLGFIDIAKELGEHSKYYKERISKFDYKEIDEFQNRLLEMDKHQKEMEKTKQKQEEEELQKSVRVLLLGKD